MAGTPDDALANPPRVRWRAGVHKYVPMASKFSKLGGIRLRFPLARAASRQIAQVLPDEHVHLALQRADVIDQLRLRVLRGAARGAPVRGAPMARRWLVGPRPPRLAPGASPSPFTKTTRHPRQPASGGGVRLLLAPKGSASVTNGAVDVAELKILFCF